MVGWGMKYLKVLLAAVAAALLAGCSSTGSENGGNVGVNEPYVPDVGSSANQGTVAQNGVAVYNPTNTVVEPSGAGTPEGNR